ncbi:MAG: permease, partial [bacterium]|nr:permease [bacterium]
MWLESLSTVVTPGFVAIKVYVFQKLSGAFIPAFFIAGAMATFIPKSTIVKYLSAGVKPIVSYPVSLVSGGILSVCACGILPIFQTIFQRGAGVGPAITFLFSGPAINIIAIVFTYQLLGTELGHARILFVLILALTLGLSFAMIFGEPKKRVSSAQLALLPSSKKSNNLPKWVLFFLLMGMVLSLPIESIPWSTKGPLNLG